MHIPEIVCNVLRFGSLIGLCLDRNFVQESIQAYPKIVISNDDGWATANIRALNDALKEAGYNVVLSAPAINQSGSGTKTQEPTELREPCQFDTCPAGSPAIGFNESNSRLNYVNAYPVDSVKYAVQTLSPKFFGGPPDFVVSGINTGPNLGPTISGSGTVGAATEASLEGIPSVAFSGITGDQVSYTTLDSDPDSSSSVAARLYSQVGVKLVHRLLFSDRPILPPGISLNVNFPSTWLCKEIDDFEFVLTRLNPFNLNKDVKTCGGTRLPWEASTVITPGKCYVTVSVFDAHTQTDADTEAQRFVLDKLGDILTCASLL